MALIPHYTQVGGIPAVTAAGFGMLACRCGQSLLIAGYEPRTFLGIAIQCGLCGEITTTPNLPHGAKPPPAVRVLERGTKNPPAAVAADTVLISREEAARLAALFQPRKTTADPHVISDQLLDDVEFQQRRWTDVPLDPSPQGYQHQPLAWAVAHFRARLRDPDWTSFTGDRDMVAVLVIAAFQDLFASWVHHPLFGAMVGSAAVEGFSLHSMAIFGAAKALALSGNGLVFRATEGPRPTIVASRLVTGEQDQMTIAVNRLNGFEFPDPAPESPQAVRAGVIEAMASVQGRINRLRPGILVLSPGAVRASFDQVLSESMAAAVASHGKRNRGLAAVAGILPKVGLTGKPREVRFAYSFYPVPNRNSAIGDKVRVGSREDYAGFS